MAGELEPGAKIGQYEIRGRLGKGGMASVYRAYQPNLDREVAIKVIADQFANDPAFVERFRREAKSIARLRHPNILTIYDFGEEGKNLYIVMEIIDGQTLKEEHENKILSLERTHEIIKQVAGALDYANKNGIIHRDVKPSNVLIDPQSGRAVLSDFGIAKMAEVDSKLTGTGTGVGTPDYMSPEQAMGDELDARSDQYSLAVVAYEMLTGRPPFTGDTPIAVAMGHVSKPLPRPSSFNPNIPPSVEHVLTKALSKKPVDRYESCGMFERALGDAVKNANMGDTVAVPTAGMKVAGGDVSSPSAVNSDAESMYQNARRNEQTNNFIGAFQVFNELNARYPGYRDVATVLDRYRAMGYTYTGTPTDPRWTNPVPTNQSQPSYPTASAIPPISGYPQGTVTYAPPVTEKKGSAMPLIIGGIAGLVVVAVVTVLIIVLAGGGGGSNATPTTQAVRVTPTTGQVNNPSPTSGGVVVVSPTSRPNVTPTRASGTTPAANTPGSTTLTYTTFKSGDGKYTVEIPDDWQHKGIPQTSFTQEAFNPGDGDFYVSVQLVRINLPGSISQKDIESLIKPNLEAANASITGSEKRTVAGVETNMGIGTLKDGLVTYNMKYVAFAKSEQLFFILYGVSPERARTYDPIFDRFLSSFKIS
jgi:serine/threonine protein kinase